MRTKKFSQERRRLNRLTKSHVISTICTAQGLGVSGGLIFRAVVCVAAVSWD
jgi:hypothetical protein